MWPGRPGSVSPTTPALKELQAYKVPVLPDTPAGSHLLWAPGPQVTYNSLFPPLPGMPDAWRSV